MIEQPPGAYAIAALPAHPVSTITALARGLCEHHAPSSERRVMPRKAKPAEAGIEVADPGSRRNRRSKREGVAAKAERLIGANTEPRTPFPIKAS
jgi:hypothetical protein